MFNNKPYSPDKCCPQHRRIIPHGCSPLHCVVGSSIHPKTALDPPPSRALLMDKFHHPDCCRARDEDSHSFLLCCEHQSRIEPPLLPPCWTRWSEPPLLRLRVTPWPVPVRPYPWNRSRSSRKPTPPAPAHHPSPTRSWRFAVAPSVPQENSSGSTLIKGLKVQGVSMYSIEW